MKHASFFFRRGIAFAAALFVLHRNCCTALSAQEAVFSEKHDSAGLVRCAEEDGGLVFLSHSRNGINSVSRTDDEKITLKKYDERMRLLHESIWKKGEDNISESVSYVYEGNNFFPASKTEENPGSFSKIVTEYTSFGLPAKKTEYRINVPQKNREAAAADNADNASFENTEQIENLSVPVEEIISAAEWTYDEAHRLVSEKISRDSRNVLTQYYYSERSSKPDEAYYENDMLKRRLVRESDAAYTETIYFSAAQTVSSRYENNIKTEEIYAADGREIRRSVF
ncbi:MAG: hypothetical protein NC041_05425 [Bacteroides sp.]|nr:hypothetical protein [Prevotella sp.]MCM1407397.1 hypothetical protein [Treponema brennaborense]MCM1469887.1 hypothetical protein [Bacteroides sp.]